MNPPSSHLGKAGDSGTGLGNRRMHILVQLLQARLRRLLPTLRPLLPLHQLRQRMELSQHAPDLALCTGEVLLGLLQYRRGGAGLRYQSLQAGPQSGGWLGVLRGECALVAGQAILPGQQLVHVAEANPG